MIHRQSRAHLTVPLLQRDISAVEKIIRRYIVLASPKWQLWFEVYSLVRRGHL